VYRHQATDMARGALLESDPLSDPHNIASGIINLVTWRTISLLFKGACTPSIGFYFRFMKFNQYILWDCSWFVDFFVTSQLLIYLYINIFETASKKTLPFFYRKSVFMKAVGVLKPNSYWFEIFRKLSIAVTTEFLKVASLWMGFRKHWGLDNFSQISS
jgi:hypothetical protein